MFGVCRYSTVIYFLRFLNDDSDSLTIMLKTWLNIKNAAAYSDVSERTLETWLRQGLRSAKVGGCRRIKIDWIDEYLEQHEVGRDEKAVSRIVDEIMEGLK